VAPTPDAPGAPSSPRAGASPPATTRPSATATATKTTRPTGGGSRSGFGVPAGLTLKRHNGDLTITRDGTVIDGLDIYGFVSVKASNVTIRNSRIRGTDPGTTNKSLISAYGDHRNLLIEDTTLRGDHPSPYLDGLKGRNFTARRVDISNVVDTALIFGDNATIENSWLHGNTHFDPDPNQPDGKSHDDNIQIEGGTNIVIRNNTIEGSFNAAIMVTQNYARSSDIRVSGNRISGGGCSINLSEKGKGPIVDMVIENNVFGTSRLDRCAVIAPPTSTPTMRANTYRDGTTVTVRKGS
ncbi:right-handed parallel beta-helix repeat-containing protein, partial [Luedemannella flava]|uniref:right-handed parallel beta-helix repeat-containing protein n=1 Tax=Luedemannella flava TaxID=349316 RepID=UPI0031D06101